MKVNEAVFLDELRAFVNSFNTRYFRHILPHRRPEKDSPEYVEYLEKRLEDYREFSDWMNENIKTLREVLDLVKPNTVEIVADHLFEYFKDDLLSMMQTRFPEPPRGHAYAQPVAHTVEKEEKEEEE